MNKITTFYRKKIYEKHNDLKTIGSHLRKDLSICTNFTQIYDDICNSQLNLIGHNYELRCDCDTCLSEIYMNLNVCDKRKRAHNQHILKCKIKNRHYNCKRRIDTILNYIYDFCSKNNCDNIVIIVPNQSDTVHKIINLILTHSKGLIVKNGPIQLHYQNTRIYLSSPLQFIEGFEINPAKVNLLLLNCFYYHMFVTSIYYEELLCLIWTFKSNNSKIVMISDPPEIFNKELNLFTQIFNDIKIIL